MAGSTIVIERRLLKSKIFRTLNGTAKTVLLDFMMKRKMQKAPGKPGKNNKWIVTNNGEMEYTYSEAEKKGIPRSSFMRAIDTLVESGFIDIAHSGSGGKKGDKSLYAISDRWKDWGTDDFVEATRRKDHRQGRGFARYWEEQNRHGYQN